MNAHLLVRSALSICGALVFVASTPAIASATFASSTTNASSSLTADTLIAPTHLAASFRCTLLGILRPVADLTWTASPSGAAGYQLERWKGTTLQATFVISGATTTTFTDGLTPTTLALSTNYTWHLRAYVGTWTSTDAVVSRTTPTFCI